MITSTIFWLFNWKFTMGVYVTHVWMWADWFALWPWARKFFVVLEDESTYALSFTLYPFSLPLDSFGWFIFSLSMFAVKPIITFIFRAILPGIGPFSMLLSLLKKALKSISIPIHNFPIWVKLVIIEGAIILEGRMCVSTFSMFFSI